MANEQTGETVEDMVELLGNEEFEVPGKKPAAKTEQQKVNDAIKKEFDLVQDVLDDYEGFGSITEMVKNKDKLVEKALNTPLKD